ncbi:MAG TPA: hypothetical protein RMH99_27330, partial [Sandaracinaceae bacterium LLY-WYZ-13_1]|nr:hypothetical protein [Sandaracinaceae bacterium LLY-WYZ-13_1]
AIRPTPQLPDRLRVHGVGARGREAQPDLIFVVDADALHYAFVPTVRIVGERVQLESAARPALPAWGEIPLGDDGRAVVLPFDDLVERLRPVAGRVPGAEVGLAATAEVASLRISRVLLSMVRAGMEPPALLSRGLHDEARSLPVELVMGEEREPPLELFVRMGGYSLSRRGAGSEDIPRVRDDRGLHFDLATLERRARAAGDVPAALRYMGVVEWGTVLDAAFHLRPESGPLSLVLY